MTEPRYIYAPHDVAGSLAEIQSQSILYTLVYRQCTGSSGKVEPGTRP